MTDLAARIAARYLYGILRSATRVASQVDSEVLRWLLARVKKGKGFVQIPLVEKAFAAMPGWSIVDTKSFLLLNTFSSGDWVLENLLNSWIKRWSVKHVSGGSAKDPILIWFENTSTIESAREDFEREVDIVSGNTPSGSPQIGRLYATKPSPTIDRKIIVDRIWLGVPGWIITAPNGQSITLPSPVSSKGKPADPNRIESFAPFWTWVYKQGIAASAQQALDAQNQEAIADLTAPAAERKKIEMRRIILPQVKALLEKIVDAKFQEVWDAWTDEHVDALKRYLDAQNARWESVKDDPFAQPDDYQYFKKNPYEAYFKNFFYKATEPDPARPRGWKVRQGNYLDLARVYGKRIAEGLREAFVIKNAYKLSLIVRTKNNLKTGKVLRMSAGSDFGGEILFTFEDGSEFTVLNKTVFKISPLGKPFEQYPTTFHDVKLPDGKAMSSPSEERMVEVFAVA